MELTPPPDNPTGPGTPPNRSNQDPATFSAAMDAAFAWVMFTFWTFLSSFRTWYASTAKPELEALQSDVAENAEVASTAAAAAAASAASAVNAPGTSGTSTTSLTVGTGSKTLTTQTGKAWGIGQPVVIARTSAPSTTRMYGTITGHNSGTGEVNVAVENSLGAGTYTDWTISLGIAQSLAGNAVGALNEARVNVASHATTADIWGAAGNAINFTGSATVTDFPAAPQAGSVRRLHCGAGVTFTNGGSLTVQGAANYTTAAGDVVTVEALTTTTFRLTVARANGLPVVIGAPNTVELGFIHVRDEKGTGSGGGTTSPGSFIDRTLNTVVTNTLTGASLSSNRVTLPAGTYRFRGAAPFYGQQTHMVALYNATDGTYVYGQSSFAGNGSLNTQSYSAVSGQFTISSTKQFGLLHRTSAGTLGNPTSYGVNEVYAELIFEKVA